LFSYAVTVVFLTALDYHNQYYISMILKVQTRRIKTKTLVIVCTQQCDGQTGDNTDGFRGWGYFSTLLHEIEVHEVTWQWIYM